MESEKVKEIKEALENCTNNYGTDCYHCPYLEKGCNIKLMEDSLTLINELESENETLKDEITESEKEKRQLCKAINSKPINIWNTDGFDRIDETLKEFIKD